MPVMCLHHQLAFACTDLAGGDCVAADARTGDGCRGIRRGSLPGLGAAADAGADGAP